MKHKYAVYLDKDSERKILKAKELNTNPELIPEMKRYELKDVTEEFELTIVDNSHNEKISHLRLKNSECERRFYSSSDSERHDLKIEEIRNLLDVATTVRLFYKDFTLFPAPSKDLIVLRDYKYYDEVTRETSRDAPFARFDIFGMDSQFSISKNRPEVIFEIIDENFHNEDLFNFLINKTINSSLIVIYFFMHSEKYYNQFVNENNLLQFRVSAFIREGVFYYCGIPVRILDNQMQEVINNPYRYFNFIEQNIVKPIKRSQQIDIGVLKTNARKFEERQ